MDYILQWLGIDPAAPPHHVAALVSLTTTSATLIVAVLLALTLTRRQMIIADRGATASVLLAISGKWDAIYPEYRRLVADTCDVEAIIRSHPDFDEFAQTKEWLEMRKVFSFFEFLGAILRTKLLHEHILFSLVTVSPSFWVKFAPMIRHYRKSCNRHDLYLAWEYLAERRLLYPPGEEHLKRTLRRRAWRRISLKLRASRHNGEHVSCL